jgi:uncharacterized lipoprotein YddW (UPF0748 family)
MIFTLLAAAIFAPQALAHPGDSRLSTPDSEMRGLWVARWSLSSPAAIRNIVASAKRSHFNTLFVQVRGRGDAWYRSDLEPRAEALAAAPSTFDPLESIVREAHKADLKVHAWINTYLVWTGEKRPKSAKHVLNAHPDWIARDRTGKYRLTPTEQVEGAFLQPSNPQVKDHLFKVFTDVASRYDVDGIHFDFVRYSCSEYDFSAGTLARFKSYMDERIGEAGAAAEKKDRTKFAYIHMFPKEWAEWRREQITDLVGRVADAVHAERPWQVVSAAVFANASDALTERGQDWPAWLRNGYLDAVCPMAYSKDTATVVKQIRHAKLVANGKHVYAGIGSWRLPSDDTAKKVAAVRALGVEGVAIFSYDGITRDGQSLAYLNNLRTKTFASRAGAPTMSWRPKRAPTTSGM